MATTRSFQDMLNQFLPNPLLEEEFVKRDWILQNTKRDDSWLSGDLIVPFMGARASNVRLGGLTPSNEIGESKPIRGVKSGQPELWGSLIFNERDLMEHGKISEQNLLKILPGEIDMFLNYCKNIVSLGFLNGETHATLTAVSGTPTDGTCTVNRPERLVVGQRVKVLDNNTAAADAYVDTIDMDTGGVALVTTRFGATAFDLTNYTVAQSARLLVDGAETAGNRFSSLKKMLLSAANGGDANLYGVAKLDYPYLQAINASGSAMGATTVLSTIFDSFIKMKNRGAKGATKVLGSYKHWASIMKTLETQKGAFRQASDARASVYGWDEIDIAGPGGKLTFVALQEIDDDYMPVLDTSALKIYSNGFFKKRQSPEGREYHEVRNTTGYQYIVDVCFFGDMILEHPSRCGVIHSIPAY